MGVSAQDVDPYLSKLIDEVWGGLPGVRVTFDRSKGDGSSRAESYRVVPRLRLARFLLPDEPAVAAAALRAYNSLRPASIARRRALTAGLMRGPGLVGRTRMRVIVEDDGRDETISAVLSEITGVEVLLAMGVGHQGPNRKPVFQAFDRGGSPVAFAKLGVDAHTDELVRNEARALQIVSTEPIPGLRTPAVLHFGSYRDHPLLVTAPLPPGVVRLLDRETDEALGTARAFAGAGEPQPLGGSEHISRLRGRLDRDPLGIGGAATGALDRIVANDPEVAFGRSHGDWVPWNLARDAGGGLVAWDWEHFAEPAPVGLDEAHFLIQSRFVGRRRPLADAVAAARQNLPRGLAAQVIDLEVLELCARGVEAASAGSSWNPRLAAQLPDVLAPIGR